MSRKLKVGVLFGGRSGEHEVSLASGEAVLAGLQSSGKYDVTPIGIDRDGRWIAAPDALGRLAASADFQLPNTAFKSTTESKPFPPAALVPGSKEPLSIRQSDTAQSAQGFDVIFPVLHGPYGEDGTIQGLCETIGIPYVGCGVLSSAMAMDKDVAKLMLSSLGLPVVPWVTIRSHDWNEAENQDKATQEALIEEVERVTGFPCFVKPANMGSSVGISKVRSGDDLIKALNHAFRFDQKVLVEQGIHAREIEVAVLGNDNPEASIPGEIIPSGEFYDYDAKYMDNSSELVIPAKLSRRIQEQIQETAIKAFQALECSGLARVDFFVSKSKSASQEFYINELNTMPGFTSISMYSKLWEASGVSYPELLDRLIQLGIERFKQRRSLEIKSK